MNPNFNDFNDCIDNLSMDRQSFKEIDMLQRDRSELLSAYIDGEVTAEERKQVQEWLQTDPKMQCLYGRLLKLRQGLLSMPVPASEQSADETLHRVYRRLNRNRTRKAILSAGGAIAAMFIATISGVFSGSQSPAPQLAEYTPSKRISTPVMVAVNRPIIEIPKAPVDVPENTIKSAAEK